MAISTENSNRNKTESSTGVVPYTRLGDAWLFVDDAINIMSSFPDECVDLIFASPPYNLSNGGSTCYAGKRVSVNKGTWDKSKGIEGQFCLSPSMDSCL